MNCTEYIWKQYRARLHGFIQSRVGDTYAADDILGEVFVRIHSQIDSLQDCGKIQSWIYQITRNAIIDHYRAQKKMEELPSTLTCPEPDVSDKAREDIDTCILPMIESLPDHYRGAVMLSEIEGRTQKEVAEKQGTSLSCAKSRVQRGRTMIRDLLLDSCKSEFDHRGNVVDYEGTGDFCSDKC